MKGIIYGMIELDCARQVEIRLVKTRESNRQQENPSTDMIS
jgi:hypothetical protein